MTSAPALTLAAALLLTSAAVAQTRPGGGDPTTPSGGESAANLSNGVGFGSRSDDNGVTSMGAEAARGRTASGNLVISRRDLRGIKACRAMSPQARAASARCRDLAATHPVEFNADDTAIDQPR